MTIASFFIRASKAINNHPFCSGLLLLCTVSGGGVVALSESQSEAQRSNIEDHQPRKKKVVVLGTGWAATSFLKGLDASLYDVQVVSPRNYFAFTPLLPSVTCGTVEARSVVEPIRNIIQKSKGEIKFWEAECVKINAADKKVFCRSNIENLVGSGDFSLDYDFLVVSVGAQVNTFNTPGVKENCHFLKNVEDAQKIRLSVIDCLEKAVLPSQSEEEQRSNLHFVIVGGGPTGVEFAAELHDYIQEDLINLYPTVKDKVKITLIQSGDHILNMFDERISSFAEQKFRRDGIEVQTGCRVLSVNDKEITMKAKSTGAVSSVPHGLIIWSTGISTLPVIRDFMEEIVEMNRKGKSHMPSLEDLRIENCNLLLFLDEECNSTILSHMKTITIDNCDKLTTIIAKRGKREGMINSCSLLESLILTDLPNLVRFCYFETYESLDKPQYMDESIGDHKSIRRHSLIDESFFPNLTSLFIEACNKINILFSHSSISSLEHLQKLIVRDCENMEEIISHQEEIEASANKISIPALQHLLLEDLPNLKDFFKGHSNLDFPSLQKVEIRNCPNMELFSRGSSNTPNLEHLTIKINSLYYYCAQKKDINIVIQGLKAFVASQGFKMLNWTKLHNDRYFFRNSEIDINEFHKLLMLVPYNEIHMFQHVKKLTLSNCDSLVEVFGSGGEDTKEGDDITHYQLQKMTLQYLPKLSHIWKHNITKVVSFQNLKDIRVSDCHNLKSLLSHSMAKSLVQLQNLVVEDCEMMEEIITKGDEYIKECNKVKTLFPKLEKLKLHHLPKLECVCSGDYDYDIPLFTVEEDHVQISFPELKKLEFREVPKLKCFCSGVYNYDIRLLSIEECPIMRTFPYGNVIINTPNLHEIDWDCVDTPTLGDLNLTIYYRHNSEKYKVHTQTQGLPT